MPPLSNEEILRRELNKKIALAYLKINARGEFINSPGTRVAHLESDDPQRKKVENDELDEFIQCAYGVKLPKKVITPGHSAPFDFIADLYYERIKNALGFANRNGGKALALDTPILTTSGWSTMGEITVGDHVYAPDGTATEVVWVGEVIHDHPCYSIHFDSGRPIVADAEHLWVVTGKAWNFKGSLIKSTEELFEDIQKVTKSKNKNIFCISPTLPIQFQERSLPVHPYVLGVWLGDGTTLSNDFHNQDEELIQRVQELWPATEFVGMTNSVGDCKTYRLHGFHSTLKAFGMPARSESLEKQIPSAYLYASVEQRLELLRGLLDTDGNIRHKRSGVEFNSTCRALAEGVYWLAKSLGFIPGFYLQGPGYYKVDGVYKKCKDVYRVGWRATKLNNPFFISRKATALLPNTYDLGHRILSIHPTESVAVRCIKVRHPSSLFLAGYSLVPTHNTKAVAVLNHLDMVFKSRCEIASAGATLDQASKCYRYFQEFCNMEWFKDFCSMFAAITGLEFVQKSIQSYTSFGNGSIQEIITGSEKGLRSPHPHKARVDEIDLIDWNVLQTGLSMARSGGGVRGQNVFTSTRQLAEGSMQKLLSTAEEKGIKVYEWNIWEVVEKCTRRCVDDPKHGSCPIYTYCKGRAHHCAGFYEIDDFIDKVRIIDRSAFETEWENKKPSRHKLVYYKFENKHIMTPEKLFSMTGLWKPSNHWFRVSGLDFGSAPGHPFVYVKWCQLPTGQWLQFHEYVAEQRLLRDHAQAIRSSPLYYGGEKIFADWDAQDRLELKGYGIYTQQAVKDVLSGIDYLSTLISGFPPAEEPQLFVWYECSHTISEFNSYSWPTRPDGKPDRSGNPMKLYDHCMDANRYALYSLKKVARSKYRMSNVPGL